MSAKNFDKNFGSQTFGRENKVEELKEVLKGRDGGPQQEDHVAPQQAASPDEITDLKAKLAKAEETLQENKQATLRAMADFENARKRLEKEKQETIRFGNEKLLHEFLPVLDNLELTLSHATDQKDPLIEGVKLVVKQFIQVLEKHGVEVISEEGTFDPHKHEAIGTQESKDHAPGAILSMHRKGYLLGGRLVRPALVTIAKAPEGDEESNDEETIH